MSELAMEQNNTGQPDSTQSDSIQPLLQVENLKVHFPVFEGMIRKKQVASIKAVDGVSLSINAGETFGLVGESGCGKSTTALALLRMQETNEGRIIFEGDDITHLNGKQLTDIRHRIQMIYQDPYSSLDPRMKVLDLIGEPLIVHKLTKTKSEYESRVRELMDLVGLLPEMISRYPHEFSGGQRQRIGIARALALEPQLLICDEPVSALDVSIQAQVVNLLMDLQERLGLTYLFIAHDLSVVRHISTRVAVMYLGKIVEIANRDELFNDPKHPYTQALLDAVPMPDPEYELSRGNKLIVGEVPSVRNPPSGCRFHPRCSQATENCSRQVPELVSMDGSRQVSCHLYN